MMFKKGKVNSNAKIVGLAALKAALFTAAVFASGVAMAAGNTYAGTDTKVCGFLNNTNGILNMASVLVVTIAVIFAGYQIAFAHKRVAEVAPVLLGGVLIGAAGQLAKMLIGKDAGNCDGTAASASIQFIQHVLHYA